MSRRKVPPPMRHQLNVAIPGDIWHRLALAARALGETQVAIVSAALRRYLDALPAETKRLMDQMDVPRKKS